MLNFEEERAKTKKKIKIIFISILVFGGLIICGHVAAGYWLYNQVEANGGVKETLVDVVKTIKQIDKESNIEKDKKWKL